MELIRCLSFNDTDGSDGTLSSPVQVDQNVNKVTGDNMKMNLRMSLPLILITNYMVNNSVRGQFQKE